MISTATIKAIYYSDYSDCIITVITIKIQILQKVVGKKKMPSIVLQSSYWNIFFQIFFYVHKVKMNYYKKWSHFLTFN